MDNNKISNLYMKHVYKNNNITYLKNCNISEYDMKRAGLNILYNTNCISKEDYDWLLSLDKRKADVIIGKWLKDRKDVSDIMMSSYIDIRKRFFELNGIYDDDEILSIKKDAIFTINHRCLNLEFDRYTFVNKNNYKSYININNIEFYLNSDKEIETKGLNHYSKEKQKDYFIELIRKCMCYDLINRKDLIFEYLVDLKDDFLTFNLPKEYYRDIFSGEYLIAFNSDSLPLMGIQEIDENTKYSLFINGNLNFLNNLIKIFLGV